MPTKSNEFAGVVARIKGYAKKIQTETAELSTLNQVSCN